MAEFASKGVAGSGLGLGTVEYLGFKFDKSDGEALINIMEKYNGD